MMNELTKEQIEAIEDMISRRMENTDETREEACEHLKKFFEERLNDLA